MVANRSECLRLPVDLDGNWWRRERIVAFLKPLVVCRSLTGSSSAWLSQLTLCLTLCPMRKRYQMNMKRWKIYQKITKTTRNAAYSNAPISSHRQLAAIICVYCQTLQWLRLVDGEIDNSWRMQRDANGFWTTSRRFRGDFTSSVSSSGSTSETWKLFLAKIFVDICCWELHGWAMADGWWKQSWRRKLLDES